MPEPGPGARAAPSIESLGTPLTYKVRGPDDATSSDRSAGSPDADQELRVRSEVRALEGMQKEALVHHGPSATVWRMVSDEGPYLKGTDLAPFPLAFYTAGVVFSFMTETLRHAADLDVEVESLAVTSDHYYSMQGSALRGDMIGGAMPIEMEVDLVAGTGQATVSRILELAQTSSPAEACMRESLRNTFSLTANENSVEMHDLRPSAHPAQDPATRFDEVEPQAGRFLDDIITKIAAAEVVHGVEGGAGSSLQAEQRRTLHVRGEARLLDATLKEIRVHLLHPIGSSFRFLSEDDGGAQAPPALAYLSAGIGFCFMTQLGRYAHITRKELASYRIVQDQVLRCGTPIAGELRPATADPVDTSVFLTLDESEDVARRMVFMGEQTCFLHAAMRGTHPTRVRLASAPASE